MSERETREFCVKDAILDDQFVTIEYDPNMPKSPFIINFYDETVVPTFFSYTELERFRDLINEVLEAHRSS